MADTTIYVVQRGDWLAKIAEEHGTTWQAIWNHPLNAEVKRKNGSPDWIYPGDVLHIPVAGPTPPNQPPPPPPPQTPPATPPAKPPVGEDDWPYGPLPEEFQKRNPRWTCPTGLCECHPTDDDGATRLHTIFFHDDLAKRMARARVRVHLNGTLVNAPKRAADDGSLEIEVPEDTTGVVLEWAPHDTPLLPNLPFRKRYLLDVPTGVGRAADQRLHHLGYHSPPPKHASPGRSLSRRVTFFQADYGLPVDGRVDRAFDTLEAFHDRAQLPPLPPGRRGKPPTPPPEKPVTPLPPDVRGSQGAVAMLQPNFPRGAITLSGVSQYRPLAFVFFIQSERKLPRWFRDCLTLGAPFRLEAHIELEHDAARRLENERLVAANRITTEEIEMLDATIRAIQSDEWHLTVGTLKELKPRIGLPPWFMATGFDHGDPPINNGGPAPHHELKGEGATMPRISGESKPTGDQDFHVEDKNGSALPGRRDKVRGLVWLSGRFEVAHRKKNEDVHEDRSVREVVNILIHELAAHAELFSAGLASVHGNPEVERRTRIIESFLPIDAATATTKARLDIAAKVPESERPKETPEEAPL